MIKILKNYNTKDLIKTSKAFTLEFEKKFVCYVVFSFFLKIAGLL